MSDKSTAVGERRESVRGIYMSTREGGHVYEYKKRGIIFMRTREGGHIYGRTRRGVTYDDQCDSALPLRPISSTARHAPPLCTPAAGWEGGCCHEHGTMIYPRPLAVVSEWVRVLALLRCLSLCVRLF